MGLFGFACGRCWDYGCSCTEDQLIEYEKECKKNRENIKPIEYSTTEPKVCTGDVVVKDGVQYFVHRVIEGVAQITILDNNAGAGLILKLEEPYNIIVSGTWK